MLNRPPSGSHYGAGRPGWAVEGSSPGLRCILGAVAFLDQVPVVEYLAILETTSRLVPRMGQEEFGRPSLAQEAC